ncbi:DUF4097 family beta strand repeat-containing protein [Alkaliflexus imshenetskii]|uniref:DUF4097 family beta strand repeat-containing protein n=1 Tax=Alkaliflexus imshenetskii TaxID=286730 RepID=UPI0004791947|nr:DUF4097 family beta strand repeat-containing protein [Alkaliflexus imshenetskii]
MRISCIHVYINRFTAILFGVLLFGLTTVDAQSYEDVWHTARSYKAVPSQMVSINNKYGSVVVVAWEQDSVRVEVTRKITERNQERMKRIRDNVNVEFDNSPRHLRVETVFGSRHSTLIRDIKEVANFSPSDTRTRVDYVVYVPANVRLNIENKYGDIVLPTLRGDVTIDLANGNLQGRDLTGKNKLTLAFGDVRLRNIREADISLNFVNFRCGETGTLRIDSRSSELEIGLVSNLEINSRRDRIQINKADVINGETYFSNLLLSQVNRTVELKLTFGELRRLVLANQFERCIIISQTCDVNIELTSPANYNALIRSLRGNLTLPATLVKARGTGTDGNGPVKYIFNAEMPDNKLQIDISDAYLKINHF